MSKKIVKLGQRLEKEELQNIHGGGTIYLFGQDCYDHFCDGEPLPLPHGYRALCAHPFDCSSNPFAP
jgi:hypothetical protein